MTDDLTSRLDYSFPSFQQYISFIKSQKDRVSSLQNICDNFQLNEYWHREKVARDLKVLENLGEVYNVTKNNFFIPNSDDLFLGRIHCQLDGTYHVHSVSKTQKHRKSILVTHHRNRVLHLDLVWVKVSKHYPQRTMEVEVVKIILEPQQKIVGTFFKIGHSGVVKPLSGRYKCLIDVEGNDEQLDDSLMEGDIVVIQITQHPNQSSQVKGKILDVLGDITQLSTQVKIAKNDNNLVDKWPPQVYEELDKVDSLIIDKTPRVDLTLLPFVTIDGSDAKDYDDAVYCSQNESGWVLWVAIADVSHYVHEGSALDHSAFERGTSVYLPEHVIPMLPEQLSNDLCSLVPNQNRLALVCKMSFNKKGELLESEFMLGTIKSHARLTYEKVSLFYDKQNNFDVLADSRSQTDFSESVYNNLCSIKLLCSSLESRLEKKGVLSFRSAETFFQFSSQGKVVGINKKQTTLAHRFIELMMLEANMSAANFLNDRYKNAIFRNHSAPKEASLRELEDILFSFGVDLELKHHDSIRAHAVHMSNAIKHTNKSDLLGLLLLRTIPKAIYDVKSEEHFGVGCDKYTHFTSPIRRYSDLVVHRLIKANLLNQKSDVGSVLNRDLQDIALQCNLAQDKAEKASRSLASRLKAEYMVDKIGEIFDGVIVAVEEFGLFVKMDNGVEGMIYIGNLGKDYFHYDASTRKMSGKHTGKTYQIGDDIKVIVDSVDRLFSPYVMLEPIKKRRYRSNR